MDTKLSGCGHAPVSKPHYLIANVRYCGACHATLDAAHDKAA